jgi:hypothetical protein
LQVIDQPAFLNQCQQWNGRNVRHSE